MKNPFKKEHDYHVSAPMHDKTLPNRAAARAYRLVLWSMGVESKMFKREYARVGSLKFIWSKTKVH